MTIFVQPKISSVRYCPSEILIGQHGWWLASYFVVIPTGPGRESGFDNFTDGSPPNAAGMTVVLEKPCLYVLNGLDLVRQAKLDFRKLINGNQKVLGPIGFFREQPPVENFSSDND